jgi:hypothetical protein
VGGGDRGHEPRLRAGVCPAREMSQELRCGLRGSWTILLHMTNRVRPESAIEVTGFVAMMMRDANSMCCRMCCC